MAKIRLQNIFNLSNLTRNLAVLLRDLTFKDNFTSFTWEGSIPANSEQKIRNELTIRPNSYMIRYQTGNALITASNTTWDDEFLYMQNQDSTNAATVKIVFWRE